MGGGVVARDGFGLARVGNTKPDLAVDDVTGAGDVTATASTASGAAGILKPGGRKADISSLIKNLSSGDLGPPAAAAASGASGSGALYPGGRKAEISSLMRNLSSGDLDGAASVTSGSGAL